MNKPDLNAVLYNIQHAQSLLENGEGSLFNLPSIIESLIDYTKMIHEEDYKRLRKDLFEEMNESKTTS